MSFVYTAKYYSCLQVQRFCRYCLYVLLDLFLGICPTQYHQWSRREIRNDLESCPNFTSLVAALSEPPPPSENPASFIIHVAYRRFEVHRALERNRTRGHEPTSVCGKRGGTRGENAVPRDRLRTRVGIQLRDTCISGKGHA